jgi:hypothetical protein
MQEMLRINIYQNLQIIIQIATDVLDPVKSIEMFESFKTLWAHDRVNYSNSKATIS